MPESHGIRKAGSRRRGGRGRTIEVVTDAPVPPDGGWGWVVVMSSFFISVLVDGVCFTFGIFYTDFLRHFGKSKSTTSWAGSVLNGTYLSVGVLVSALANRYGCRRVTITGAIIAASSFFVSTFSPNIACLTIFYGFFGGLGFGLMYLPALVMVGYYFEERRAFATGIAVCGSGIGAFVFAPICDYLIGEYSWKGAMWIIAGVVAHGMVFGAFYRPLNPIITIVEPSDEDILMSNLSTPIVKNTNANKVEKKSRFQIPDIVVTSAESTELLENVSDKTNPHSRNNDISWEGAPAQRGRSMTHDASTLRSSVANNEHVARSPHYRFKVSDVYGLGWSKGHHQRQELVALTKSQDSGMPHARSRGNHEQPVHGFLDVARPLYRKDIFYSGSVYHLPQFMSVSSINDYVKSVTRIPTEEDTTKLSRCLRWLHLPRVARDILEDMLDMSILTSPTFSIYALSCTLSMIGFFIPFIYLPELAVELGTDRQRAAFLVSILGITNTVGRVVSGILCDRTWVDCLVINNVSLILAGLATLAVPAYHSYALLATYCAFFGLCISPFVSLRTVIVVELLGLDKLSNSFGFITMFQGASSFVGVPIAGAFSDMTGTYDASFYLSGIVLVVSGAMCLPLRRIKKWENDRKERKIKEENSGGDES